MRTQRNPLLGARSSGDVDPSGGLNAATKDTNSGMIQPHPPPSTELTTATHHQQPQVGKKAVTTLHRTRFWEPSGEGNEGKHRTKRTRKLLKRCVRCLGRLGPRVCEGLRCLVLLWGLGLEGMRSILEAPSLVIQAHSATLHVCGQWRQPFRICQVSQLARKGMFST